MFEKKHTSISCLFCSVNILLTPLYSKAQKNCKIGTKGRGRKRNTRKVHKKRSTQENVSRWRIALKCWGGK